MHRGKKKKKRERFLWVKRQSLFKLKFKKNPNLIKKMYLFCGDERVKKYGHRVIFDASKKLTQLF